MPTTTQLQAYAQAGTEPMDVGHVLLIDGIATGLCDRRGLVGISTGGGHNVVLGLSREGLWIRKAIDLRTGQFLDSPLRATLRDFDGTLDLAALFRAIDDTERSLDDVPVGAGLPIGPSSDLSTRNDLFDSNIGTERIGPAGERHRYPVPTSFTIGMQHRMASSLLHLSASPVSDEPIVWDGRRIELYRVYRDHVTYPDDDTLGWRPADEWVLRWWGTMRDDGDVAGHEFQIECDGPESWLRKPLGVGFQHEPVPAVAQFELSAEESAIAIRIDIPSAADPDYGIAEWTYTITGTTPETIRQDFIDAIADLAGTVGGSAGVYNDQAGCSVSMDDQGVIRISVVSTAVSQARITIGAHAKAWAIVGYVPDWQNALVPNYDDTRAAKFYPQSDQYQFFSTGAPGDGYVIGYFYTGDQLDPSPVTDADPLGLLNGGVPRVFRPWYLSGTQVLFADPTQGGTRAGQLVRLSDAALGVDTSQSTVAHPGQLDFPPASAIENPGAAYTLNGSPVNRQGLWLFFGKRRLADPNGTGEVVDEYQVARASWVNASGQQNGLVSGDTILVTEWLEPGLFGFNRPKLGNDALNQDDHQWAGDWVSRVDVINPGDGALFAVPIVGLGYVNGSTDRADIVLLRLLLTTGTSQGWDGYNAEDDAAQDPGDNEPAETSTIAVLDAEMAELGLGIPRARVQSVASWSAVVDHVDTPAILEAKVAFSGGYQALDAARALMQPAGLCWQLRGGQYGIFCPADSATLADAEFVLDRSVKTKKPAEAASEDSRQRLRKAQPIDRWTFDASWAPHLNATQQKIDLLSPDPGYTYRPGDVPITVPAHAYRPSQGSGGLTDRVAYVSKFWARRHFEVKGYRVSLAQGEEIWPGSIGRLTDPALVDPRGTTGITNRIVICTGHTEVLDVRDGYVLLDLLVLADRTITPRLNAPVAVGYRWDPATSTASLYDNYFGFEDDGWSDVAQFVEPAYDGITAIGGGGPTVAGYQWDGDSLQLRITGAVASIVTTAGAASMTLTGTSGTAYRDMDTIWVLQPRDQVQNVAWVEAIHAPICADTGTFNDGHNPIAGYPWEP